MLLLLFMLHLDSLDLSGVEVAETKIHQFQGDRSQLMNWEEYGIKIDVAEGSILEAETVEVGVKALVGGQFKFPENTVLVSAVYAVSISKRLLKPLRIKMEHCVDLTGRPDLAKHLKFAIAPTDAPHLPYQFSLLEEGEFDSDSCYGSICRYRFCLVCIVAEVTKGGQDLQEQENEESGGQQGEGGQEQQGGGGGQEQQGGLGGGGGGGGGGQEQQGGLGGGGGQEQQGGLGGGGGGQEQQGGLGGGGEQGGEESEEVKGGKEQDEQPEGERKHQPQEVKQKSREGQQQQSADYQQQESRSGKSDQQHKQRQQIGSEYILVSVRYLVNKAVFALINDFIG